MAEVEERQRKKQERGEETIYGLDKCFNVKFNIGIIRFDFNPVVSAFSAIIIWAFVIWCIAKPESSLKEMSKWKDWITKTWTWFYIGTQDVWAVFVVILYFSKYANIKLGDDDEEPEYNDATYFTMLFAAGIGIGLFFFGVAESVFHYAPGPYGNRYWKRYTDNQRAQDAVNLTLFHWGIHGWIVYAVIGLLLGFLSYRKKLPMTMRSCFYPLLGERVFGILGDIIDILSVVATMFGVCTSLGLGAIQLNTGFKRINSKIDISTNNQIITIWGITALATASVISGIKVGIRRLSEICFALGMIIFTIAFLYDDTWYLLNLYVQSIGYYLQYIIQLGFHTDAFAQLGNAPDKFEAPNWIDGWTIFYWGWWIAWSPFVGMFIAKISRGRTIKNFITYTLTIPILYSFLWMSVFGGIGIKMERDATNAGLNCSNPIRGTLYMLSCRTKEDMWFDVMQKYGDLGTFLSVLSIMGIILYFVTSSDSGSLIIDCLSANGKQDPPIIQRIFWALTEGACATALLKAGGSKALSALQTASIASGLPYTVLLNFMCVALWRALKHDQGDWNPQDSEFTMGIFDINTWERFKMVFISIFCPWYYMGKAAGKLNRRNPAIYMVLFALVFYLWIILMICEVKVDGISYVAWTSFLFFIVYCAGVRISVRENYKIDGNMVEDFFAVLILYPLAAVQMWHQVKYGKVPYAVNGGNEVEVGIENAAVVIRPLEDRTDAEMKVPPPSYDNTQM